MKKRALLLAVFILATWVAGEAVAAGQREPEFAVRLVNHEKQDVLVRIYWEHDPFKLEPCWKGEIRGGSTVVVPLSPWPGCGAWSTYRIYAELVSARDPFGFPSIIECILIAKDIPRGIEVNLKKVEGVNLCTP